MGNDKDKEKIQNNLGIHSSVSAHSATSPVLVQYVALPPWDQEKTIKHYAQADDKTPTICITGYHGVAIAGEPDSLRFTLYLIDNDKEKVVARLVIKEGDLRKTTAALTDLIENYGKSEK